MGVNQQKLDKVLRTNAAYIPTERHLWSLSVGSDSKAASIKTCLSKLSRLIQGLCYKELLCFSSLFIVLRRAMNHSDGNFVKLQGEKKVLNDLKMVLNSQSVTSFMSHSLTFSNHFFSICSLLILRISLTSYHTWAASILPSFCTHLILSHTP